MTVEEMRVRFNELNVTLRQIGVDDEKSFIDDRIVLGERLLQKDDQPFLIQYAKRGVPPSLWARVYKKIFNISIKHREEEYLKSLVEHHKQWEVITDELIHVDPFDNHYFIFEEYILKTMVCFFRDS